MAKVCKICEKKSAMGRQYKKLISKYNPSPKKRKYPNLQWVSVPEDTIKEAYKQYAGKKILACTKCIKALSKEK
ncbi:MAG: L28 family ribosomal protein [Candidatus Pacebacteria bacterium]|nr:L28 family ribosomal protein [Candidatus Paceibacterota bacterium]